MVLWCADGLTEEERLAWYNKVIHIKERIAQYKGEMEVYRHNIQANEINRASLGEEEYSRQMREDTQAFYESARNVASDERYIDTLLNGGQGANTAASSSTAGTTRNISDVSGSNEQGPSKK